MSRLPLRDVLTCRLVSKAWSAAAAGTVRHLDLSLKQPYGSSAVRTCRTSRHAERRADAAEPCAADTQREGLQPDAQKAEGPEGVAGSEGPRSTAGPVPGPNLAGACEEHVGGRRSEAAADGAQQGVRDVRQQLQELLPYLYDTWPGVESLTLSCAAAGRGLHPGLSLAVRRQDGDRQMPCRCFA